MQETRSLHSIRVPMAALLLLATATAHPDGGEQMRFRERTGDDVQYLESSERRVGDYLELRSESSTGEVHIVMVYAETLESTSWQHIDPEASTDYTARRSGRTISVTGRSDGTRVDETFELDDEDPWIQSIERSLQPFVLSDRDRIRFWTVQPGELQLRKLQAARRGRTTIELDGRPTDVIEVRVSLPGIGSVFWSATYRFRASDGQFVQSEAVRGWPGTPKTIVEKLAGGTRR